MLLLCFLFINVLSVSSQQSSCKWIVIVENIAYTLDLRPLYNFSIWSGGNRHTYKYSPCNDGELCTNQNNNTEKTGMAIRYPDGPPYPPPCDILAKWDSSISPTMNIDDPQRPQFSFIYHNGDECLGSSLYFDTIWICSPSDNIPNAIIAYSLDECGNSTRMIIFSKYACVSVTNITTTTESPENECVWITSDGQNILNLTAISGNIYTAINNNDNSELFAISPCSNQLKCGIGHSAMSTLIKIGSFIRCLKYLSVWDQGIIEPNYDSNSKTWQFIYQNGELCNGINGLPINYEVYWHCNHFSGNAVITDARQISQCLFQIHIDSKYAC